MVDSIIKSERYRNENVFDFLGSTNPAHAPPAIGDNNHRGSISEGKGRVVQGWELAKGNQGGIQPKAGYR
jgi:hypothetical protein